MTEGHEPLCLGVCMADENGYCLGCGRAPWTNPPMPNAAPLNTENPKNTQNRQNQASPSNDGASSASTSANKTPGNI